MRRIGGVLVVLVVAVGLAAAATIFFRFRLTAAVVRYGLDRAGFPDARFTLERVDREAIVLAQIESGAAMRIERCEIALDWSRLPSLPVERVRVIGARIDVTRPVPSGEAPSDEAEPPSGSLPVGLVPALELEDAVATIDSPTGPVVVRVDSRVDPEKDALVMKLDGKAQGKDVDATFGGEARLDAGGAVSITVRLTALATPIPIGAFEAKIPAELERSGGRWIAKIAGADLVLRDEHLHASAISGEASARAATLSIGSLEDTAATRRFEPIEVEARLTRSEPEVDFSADVRSAHGRATLHAEGRYDSSRKVALADLTIPRVTLGKGRLRLLDLSPLLGTIGETEGTVEGDAHLRWNAAKGVSGDARVKLADISANSSRIRFDGLAGEVKLSRLFPPVTAGAQTLRIHELHPGVLFSDATLTFGLEPAKPARGSRLRIARFETAFAGGRIRVDDTVLDPFAAANSIVFRLDDLDAVELFKIAAIEGVAGTGKLTGSIPVTVKQGAVAIPKGELVAKGGVLQIRSQQAAQLLAGGGPSVELLLDALRDFHYDELTVTITKELDGEAAIMLHLAGQNPAVMDAQPFRINLNLTGNLDRLVASLLEVARLSDQAVRATVNAVKPEGN